MNNNGKEPVKRRQSTASRRVENAIRRQTLTGLSILSNFIHPLGLSSGRKEKSQSVFYDPTSLTSSSVASQCYADVTAFTETIELTGDLDCEIILPLFDCEPEAADVDVDAAAEQSRPVDDGSCPHCQYLHIHSI